MRGTAVFAADPIFLWPSGDNALRGVLVDCAADGDVLLMLIGVSHLDDVFYDFFFLFFFFDFFADTD